MKFATVKLSPYERAINKLNDLPRNLDKIFSEALEDLRRQRDEVKSENQKLKLEIEALKKDDPEWDATDAAHPAWWRGSDYGVEKAVKAINNMMDAFESKNAEANSSGNFGSNDLNLLRDRLRRVYSVLDLKGKTFF